MSAPSPWLRPLQVLAIALAVAIVALSVVWIRMEPPLVPHPMPVAAQPQDEPAGPASGVRQDATAVAPATTRVGADESVVAPLTPVATFATLHGTVTHADGTAVTDGCFWLHRDGEELGASLPVAGAFSFAGLQPGVHRLTARIPDELAIDREVRVSAPSTRLDIRLAPRWRLQVNVVTSAGTPLVEALVGRLDAMRGGLFVRSLRALGFPRPLTGDLPSGGDSGSTVGLGPFRRNDPFDMDGQQALPKQALGVLTMPTDAPAHVALVLGTTLIDQQPAAPGQQSVTFVLDVATLLAKTCTARFRCIDASSAPVVGARVSVDSLHETWSAADRVTDSEGSFTVNHLLPGRVVFGVKHPRLRMPPLQADLVAGADVDCGDVTLREGVEIELSFVGFGGGGSVVMCACDAPVNSRWRTRNAHAFSENGPVRKVSLFPGRYSVLAMGRNGTALLELDTAALPPQPVRFDLRAGATLHIDHQFAPGLARFEIATPRGMAVYRGELGHLGTFQLELPPGDYVATTHDGTGTTRRSAFMLPAGGARLQWP